MFSQVFVSHSVDREVGMVTHPSLGGTHPLSRSDTTESA